MSANMRISNGIVDAWDKLSALWKGEAPDAFHREYIAMIIETVDEFEKACVDLTDISTELYKEMQLIERSLEN